MRYNAATTREEIQGLTEAINRWRQMKDCYERRQAIKKLEEELEKAKLECEER